MLESSSLYKQIQFKFDFFITQFKDLDSDLIKNFDIVKAKTVKENNKPTKFISEKIDIAEELTANKSY